MLRSTRGLLLLALVLMMGAVGAIYYRQKRRQARHEPRPPASLPINKEVEAITWVWRKDELHGNVEVRAKRFSQLKAPSLVEIEDVEVLILKNDGKDLDRIHTPKAQFDDDKGTLHSDADVYIELGLPVEGPPHGHQLKIHSSGVTYEAKTGKAQTALAASFQFDEGDGKSVGASYDPALGKLEMDSQVELHWLGKNPQGEPMKIETGQATYLEKDAYVLLGPWSRLTKGTTVVEAGEAVVTLNDEGTIDEIETTQAHGTDNQPGRQLQYSAGQLHLKLTPKGEVEKISGEPDARLLSVTDAARTNVSCYRVDLDFDTNSPGSPLKQAVTSGNTVLEAVPLPRPGVLLPETKVLRTERAVLKMRPDGKELDTVESVTPSHLEFLPTRAGQRHRSLDASSLFVAYGADNVIQWFRAENATTRTEPEPLPPAKPGEKPKKPGDPVLTHSKYLKADFDKNGELARIEQSGDFTYQEGERHARANKGILEQARNLITLDQNARMWDASGTTSADHIVMDQKSGDVAADGNVVSTRMPDRQGSSSAMLSNDEPMQATAARMRTAERNHQFHYEGRAVAWQGSNRIWADAIDIDRTARRLSANGHVRTRFVEKQKREGGAATDGGAGKKDAAAKTDGAAKTTAQPAAQAPTFVNVEAAALVYTESDRVAHYTGGSHMVRPGMDVKGSEIRAFLNDAKADSSLDHAIADGQVAIVRTEPDRTLTGTGEHCEYYEKDERIFMKGGHPVLVDSLRGTTKGEELTYYVNDDKLIVNGEKKDLVTTRILRRHH
jgi:lipopolysaccharide export system protein LptA